LIFEKKYYFGVQLFYDSIDKVNIGFVKTQKRGNAVVVIEATSKLTSIEDIKNKFPIDVPVIVSVDGKIVIHKRFDIVDSYSTMDYFKKAFPGAEIKNFYVQLFKNEKYIFLSVGRKEKIDSIINEFLNNKFSLVSFIFGPFIICNISTSELFNTDKIGIGNGKLLFEKSQLTEYLMEISSDEDSRILIGKEDIQAMYVIPFLHVIAFLNGIKSGLEIDSVISSSQDFHYNNKIKTIGQIAMLFFMILLIANFIIFSRLGDSVQYYTSRINTNELSNSKYLKTRLELDQKKSLLIRSGINQNFRISYFIDEIAISVPKNIILDELTFNPWKKDDAEELVFESGIIHVSGKCLDSEDINLWMNTLKSHRWVKEISEFSYFYDSDEKKGLFNFRIRIS
jgi:hypothetical protein